MSAERRNTIGLEPVESSQIAAIGHDPASSTLAVQFAPNAKRDEAAGSIYHYAGVDAELFDRFRHAPSKGAFFGAYIKCAPDRFPYAKVESARKKERA